jgi:hypothetical protein
VTQIYNYAYSWQALRSFSACSVAFEDSSHNIHWVCSCAMVSPSIVLTAAHCAERNGLKPLDRVSFRMYCNQDYTCHTDEVFDCAQIPFYSLQASDSDIMLMECDPNAQGILPGDKYGFIDTYNPTSIPLGTATASFWRNPVNNDPKGPQDTRTILYSWGQIDSNNSGAWPSVSCDQNTPAGTYRSDLYTNDGASGSLWIFEEWGYRTLVAPTSTGEIEGYGRHVAILSNSLWGDTDDFPWVEEYVDFYDPNPGLCNQSLHVHKMDENLDGVFDAIMEVDSNLAPRDIYSLNIDARHRRLMWSIIPGPHTFTWVWQSQSSPWLFVSGKVVPNSGTTGYQEFLRRTLPLQTGTKYHVRVEFQRQNTQKNDLYLRIKLYCPSFVNTFDKYYNYFSEPIDPKMYTFEIDTTSCTDDPQLRFYYKNESGIIIHRVTVQKSGAYWDFENYDTREDWRKDNDEGHALITPDGYGWPGYAAVPYGEPSKEWNENCMNRAMALLPSRSYTLYFYARRKNYYGNPSYVLVRSKTAFSQGENNVLYREFTPPSSGGWQLYGYTFTTNNYHDYYLSFGQKWYGHYYIDGVRLVKN